MYKLGDIVVHPLHGAGIIDGLESKKVLTKLVKFYIITLADSSMDKLYVPVAKATELGLRMPNNIEIIDKIKSYLMELFHLEINNVWKEQFKILEAKVNSGNVLNVCEAYKFLFHKSLKKKLGSMDRWLLKKALDIIGSELHFITGADFKQTKENIETWVHQSIDTSQSDVA